ncbi:hypothetical protein Dsin_010128 [Dipteronia sinensis]|uniref:RING-type E3 ubiquitin transferase n=1 Tax=Dipteronia sinensis TaxID=43782 RepID=A0AAE0ECA1_9ROSI|nr:hypothetical protein Dsin_010128 [Dipteronia sinensis]
MSSRLGCDRFVIRVVQWRLGNPWKNSKEGTTVECRRASPPVKTLLKRVRVEEAVVAGDDEKQETKRRRVSESERQIMNCSICLEELWLESNGMVMPCSHVFHAECTMKWLKVSHFCPLCCYEMPTDRDKNIQYAILGGDH